MEQSVGHPASTFAARTASAKGPSPLRGHPLIPGGSMGPTPPPAYGTQAPGSGGRGTDRTRIGSGVDESEARAMPTTYPEWFYYPSRSRSPEWVPAFLGVVAAAREFIDSETVDSLTSDRVLARLRPGLEALGYQVESGKHHDEKIRRPVLFGDNGIERVAYEVDAVHDEMGILVEVEAGRGARGNAVYRDLVRASLIVDARFLVLGVMRAYRHLSGGRAITVSSYHDAKGTLDALFASGRLALPFEGVLLFGY